MCKSRTQPPLPACLPLLSSSPSHLPANDNNHLFLCSPAILARRLHFVRAGAFLFTLRSLRFNTRSSSEKVWINRCWINEWTNIVVRRDQAKPDQQDLQYKLKMKHIVVKKIRTEGLHGDQPAKPCCFMNKENEVERWSDWTKSWAPVWNWNIKMACSEAPVTPAGARLWSSHGQLQPRSSCGLGEPAWHSQGWKQG